LAVDDWDDTPAQSIVIDRSIYDQVEQVQGYFYSPYYQGEPLKTWNHQYQLSLDLTKSRGNSPETDLSTTITLASSYHKFVNRLKLLSEYDETGGNDTPATINNEHYLVDDVMEWHYLKNLYWFVGGYWEQDIPAGYYSKYGSKTGIGTYLVQNDAVVLRMEGGIHGVKEEYVDPFKRDTISSYLVASDFTWNINNNTSLQAEVDMLHAIDDGRDLRIKSNVSLNVNIAGNFGIAIENKMHYDKIPVPSYRTTDNTLTISITYGN
jgi:putative salt-induced outer membrane protein YdiY